MSQKLSKEVDGKMRQYYRVLMSYVDFQQATEIADYIIRNELHGKYPEDRFLWQGLNTSMILAYGRPFSGNDKGAEYKIPDLPRRIINVLSKNDLELHVILIEDRNAVLAHSDSRAWKPNPVVYSGLSGDLIIPLFKDPHAPLTLENTVHFKEVSQKLMESCFSERERLEDELKPYLPRVELNNESKFQKS